MMGIPSLAFAKDALADDNAQVSTQSADTGEGSSSSAADQSSDGATTEEEVVEAIVPSNSPTEVVEGDVVFFGVDSIAPLALPEGTTAKGSQQPGSSVTVKLRSQIHPSTPSGNLTTDFGVIAEVLNTNGAVIASAEFVPATNVATSDDAEDGTEIIGDYIAKFPNRIPENTDPGYTLRVSGKNYVSHVENNFFVHNGNTITVDLVDMVNASSDPNSVSATIKNDNNIQGLMPYGDFDNDGRVDNDDTRMMTKALSATATPEAIAMYDINADGTFNLLDVQYFATTIKEGNNTASNLEELISVIHAKKHTVKKDTSFTKVATTNDNRIIVGTEASSEAPLTVDTDGDGIPDSPAPVSDPAYADNLLREALFENPDLTVILKQDKAVSAESPVSIEIATPAIVTEGNDDTAIDSSIIEMAGLTITPPTETKADKSFTNGEVSAPLSGSVTVTTDDDKEMTITFQNGKQVGTPEVVDLLDAALRAGSEEANAAALAAEPIIIDFGTRIAIKKIVIKVTETTLPTATLAEIGKVEFLNNMEDRIAPPDLSIPTGLSGTPGDKQIAFAWDPQTNITGYEIRITDPAGKTTTTSTVLPKYTIADKKLKSGIYTVAVRSSNGNWKSPWCLDITSELVPTKRPDMPTGIKLTPGYGEIIVSWPAVDDATYYTLYYKEDGAARYTTVERIEATKYTISKLKENTKYLIYLTASNDKGTSPGSEVRSTTTLGQASVKVPWYNLINRTVQYKSGKIFQQGGSSQNWDLRDHIAEIKATGPNDESANPGFKPEWMIDGDYTTGFIPSRMSTYYDGANVTFDQAYDMDTMVVTTSLLKGYAYTDAADITLRVMDENNKWTSYSLKAGTVKMSSLGSQAPGTFRLTFPKSHVKQLIFGTMRVYGFKVPVAEIAFYEYDDTADRINNLWADDLHTVLKEEVDGTPVNEALLAELEAEVNTVDPATVEVDAESVVIPSSGECSPNKTILEASIQSARDALKFNGATEPARIYSSIDSSTNANVGGLNDWQPIGIAAYSGESIQVFVGGRTAANAQPMATNSGQTPLLLGIGQNGAETGNVYKQIAHLNYGANDIIVPETGNNIDALENGGQLYVRAVTSNKSMEFNVRVLGGMEIACLNLYKVTNDDDYYAACAKYVDKLNDQVANLKATHDKFGHKENYTKQTCVANTTDIMLDSIMYSVPASQILSSLKHKGDRDGQIQQLITSTKSSSEMMNLYWQHKGLWKMTTAEQKLYGGKNGIPAGHLNPRFMRMNPGVFMYAAGNHIGVQYGSATFAGQPGVTFDENGMWLSGRYFGWGVAHEIGHQINQGCYTYAEVTNNYYAQLGQVNESNAKSRYNYQTLYNRVTSGAKGAPEGKTGIGLYWLLHLAYDNGYNYKMYDSYTDVYNNIIMARIDSIARNPSAAPGTGFTLSGANKDNALMRLACAAAGDAASGYGRNILDYFIAWGQTPDATTIAYASQFEKDDRLIQYINDEARVYRIKGGQSVGASTEVWADLYEGDASNVGNNDKKVEQSKSLNTRQVTIQAGIVGDNTDGLIGIEFLRNGKAVGFKMFNGNSSTITFTDTILTENNRTYTYSVRAVDNLLATSQNTITFPMIKLADKGTYGDKSRWDANTNMISSADQGYNYDVPAVDADESGAAAEDEFIEEPSSCENELQTKAVMAVIDGKADSAYAGSLPTGDAVPTDEAGNAVAVSTPYVEIDFGSTLQVTGITVPTADSETVKGATIQVFDGESWQNVAPGTGVPTDKDITYYFNQADDPQLHIYTAAKLRIVAPAGATGLTLHEVDVLGPVGDNADFLDGDGWVGYIDAATTYAPEPVGYEGEYTIPEGSLVFVGSYKGDTAYNALKFYKMTDEGEKLVGGTQVFFAEEPGEGRNLGVTADGRWIYYITPDDMHDLGWTTPDEVYVELYRVDDAFTLENERLVASSLLMKVPSDIPRIHLNISNPTNMGDPTVSE